MAAHNVGESFNDFARHNRIPLSVAKLSSLELMTLFQLFTVRLF